MKMLLEFLTCHGLSADSEVLRHASVLLAKTVGIGASTPGRLQSLSASASAMEETLRALSNAPRGRLHEISIALVPVDTEPLGYENEEFLEGLRAVVRKAAARWPTFEIDRLTALLLALVRARQPVLFRVERFLRKDSLPEVCAKIAVAIRQPPRTNVAEASAFVATWAIRELPRKRKPRPRRRSPPPRRRS